MLKITDAALEQIKKSMAKDNAGLSLRIAAAKDKDDAIQYGMGFDDNKTDDDAVIELDGLEVIVAPDSRDLLIGATIDYVALDGDNMHFIFINPNDPNHKAPETD